MGHIHLTGTPNHVSREFVRAWLNASACVLAFHGYPIDLATLRVRVVDLSKRTNHVTGGGVGGTGCASTNTIELERSGDREWMATTILHECIHVAFGSFEDGTNELITSTLTAKLKPTAAKLAQVLQEDDNANRAHVAHRKLSYMNEPGEPDRYNDAQDERIGVTDKHHERRKGGE
jgi:hypothetical protein